MPTRDRHALDAAVVDDLDGIARDRFGRDDDRRRLLAEDDVGFDRHADPQRRVVRQQEIDAEGLAGRIALGRDLRDAGAQRLSRESLAAQEGLLADRDAVDFLFIDFGNDLHRQRRADPEQHVGRPDDLADLAVAPQHHAVERRAQHKLVDPHLLGRDPRLVFLGLGPALLIFLLRGVALGAVLLGPLEVALRLLAGELQLVQRAAFLGVVLPAEHLAGLHRLPLAGAEIDQAAPLQRHHLGPARRLDRTGAVDGLGDGRRVPQGWS